MDVIVASLLLVLFVSWFLVRPHLVGAHASEAILPQVSPSNDTLPEQKERCVQVLKDLELDFATGKVSEEDYEETKRGLTAELAGILRALGEIR